VVCCKSPVITPKGLAHAAAGGGIESMGGGYI